MDRIVSPNHYGIPLKTQKILSKSVEPFRRSLATNICREEIYIYIYIYIYIAIVKTQEQLQDMLKGMVATGRKCGMEIDIKNHK